MASIDQFVVLGGREAPNKRMEPSGAIVFKEAWRLSPGGHELTFNCMARGARVAHGSCAIR